MTFMLNWMRAGRERAGSAAGARAAAGVRFGTPPFAGTGVSLLLPQSPP